MTPSWLLLLCYLLSYQESEGALIQYTEISEVVHIKFNGPLHETVVETKQQCVERAYQHIITTGAMTKMDNGSVLCQLMRYLAVVSSQPDKERNKNVVFFMVDLRNQDTCSATTTKVADIMSDFSKCDKDIKRKLLCEDLKDLKAGCTDNTNSVCNRKHCADGGFYTFAKASKKCLSSERIERGTPGNFILNKCAESYNGSSISINSEEENDEIGARAVMIGLHIPDGVRWSKDSFEWLDGFTSSYRNWAEGYPKEGKGNFVYLHGSDTAEGYAGKWINFDSANSFELLELNQEVVVFCSRPRLEKLMHVN
ncbi:hypothetical protein L596_027446 [Steinernema carpocapsae]|uniref:C-type lectin domain-containing protein n=1 Tax=Steinernema carpocapsae TaxID=34508 RepID=A0A4U5M4C7_STECR|nr:hypothetical protein L596_027446 [Steinernema carpocapsae]